MQRTMRHEAALQATFVVGLIALTLCSLALQAEAAPVYTTKYVTLVDSSGLSGACRGNGGSNDKVDMKSKGGMTQLACENECDGLQDCVAYAYNAGANNGECLIYGEGMDGSCSLAGKHFGERGCGTCSINGKDTKAECGTCSGGTPAPCSATKCYAETEDQCVNSGGTWTPGSWVPGTWSAPSGGWQGDSHHTTHVHTTVATAGYDCYDKMHWDGQDSCEGSTNCAINFENLRTCPDGCTNTPRSGNIPRTCNGAASDPESTPDCKKAFEDSSTAAHCTATAGCTFKKGPTFHARTKKVFSHVKIMPMDGWTNEM